jgi:uncharacterized repeat protein (TIGR02543 family)
MLWQYDKVSDSFSEQSNVYTDSSSFSVSRVAVMLINNTVAPGNFTYTARLTAGDDDAFGLIWGYQSEDVYYRVYFSRQNRAAIGWPYLGWGVDRMNNGQITDLFGPSQSFVNTAGRPFDVTISISGGLLNLTVVDDPLGSPTTYNLVTDGALPTSPSAKVGMFSWGNSAGTPRAFRVQNPVLSPTPLTGNPSATVLSNWSFLIPPGGTGTTNVTVSPMWSQGLGPNGDKGTMIENSDWTANNIAQATTNFPAPTAVAGNVNWSNYVYSARFITSDDDAFGMLLRYKDETNFYRVAFRSQNSTSGVKRGISIQRNVNLNFDQIFASTAFLPPTNSPMDAYVSINTNRLQVLVLTNVTGASPGGFLFGPFDLTGATVDNGKIGVFSWAQFSTPGGNAGPDSGTEVDSVKVQQVSGEGLLVSSAYGTPVPPVGLNDLPVSGSVTASVDSITVTSPGVRQVSIGWNGLGSVPGTGTTNQVVFTLNTFSSIAWKWRVEYLLTTSATVGGTVSATLGPWISAGSNVTVTATPSAGFIFAGWSGDSISLNPSLTFAMNHPFTLTAKFEADSDGDGLPDSWELANFGNLSQTAAGDPDGDGVSNLNEYLRGTNPNFAEALVATDGLSSQWINTQRDPALPSMLRVIDFGSGYRGAFDDSNDNRSGDDFSFIASTNYADYASWQSPIVTVKPSLWNNTWSSNFSASAEFSVGDNDANCFYFRYRDESKWFRATLCGDPNEIISRPRVGLTIQRRLNSNYSTVVTNYISGPSSSAITDPLDGSGTPAGFKRVKVTVNATNENFEVRVIGWNALLAVPDFDPNWELVVSFTDTNHSSGRIGFGLWGQGAFGNNQNQTNGIPIPYGAMVDNISVKSPASGGVVFSETWETAALTNEFPAGWSNPYTGYTPLEGQWWMSAHGTIAQEGNNGLLTTGTSIAPKADADGPILLAPNQGTANYYLEVGIHAFDDDGVGFVYDFQDSNNFSRVMFRAEATYDGDIPPGLSVSRKSGGVWSDIVAGDPTSSYVPGRPFGLEFANNNGACRLLARELDNPANIFRWQWTSPAPSAGNRFGLTTWASIDAHFLYARAYSLPTITAFKITQIRVQGGNVILDLTKPAGSNYNVLRANNVLGPYQPVATGLSSLQYSEPLPAGSPHFYRLQLAP